MIPMNRRTFIKTAGATALMALGIGCLGSNSGAKTKEFTLYSGRGEELIQPIIDRYTQATGVRVNVKYGGTAELAATILEEGQNSPADLFFAQDAGALGALSKENRLAQIPSNILPKVESRFRSPKNEWIGITGRARTVDYNVNIIDPSELPTSIWGFTEKRWAKGRIGWAPTNGSFQSFVTALRVLEGEERARDWLEGILDNEPQVYPKNTPIVAALGREEIDVGFVNNYYLHRFKTEDPDFPVAHHYTKGDAGSLINIAGVGLLDSSKNIGTAQTFIEYMLGIDAQSYFANETFEYPLVQGVEVLGPQKPLSEIETPDIDLSDLDDLLGTLQMLQDVGAL